MSESARNLKELIDQIRRCFWLMGAVADEALADLALSASMRAVLEHLDEHGPSTVPHIAAAKTVRRQSIQELADRLCEAGLGEFHENPAHRRSQLLTLTRKGRSVFAEVRARDARLLRALAASLSDRRVVESTATLKTLRSALEQLRKGGRDDDN